MRRSICSSIWSGSCSRNPNARTPTSSTPAANRSTRRYGSGARHQRGELGRHRHARQYIESLFLQVADARRKAEAQQPAHGEDVIGEAAGVGVVLVNDEATLVTEQSVEDIGRLVSGRGDHVGVKGPKLIG